MQNTSCTLAWWVEGKVLEVQTHRDLPCVQVVIVGLVFHCPYSGALLGRDDPHGAVSLRQNTECSPVALSLQLPLLCHQPQVGLEDLGKFMNQIFISIPFF